MSPPILIRNGVLVTMDPARSVRRADLLLAGGRIQSIGEGLGAPRGAITLEAEGMLVLPGLVQAHVHLCQTLFRGQAGGRELLPWLRERIFPLEAAHDDASLRASARLGIAELLLSGTTAIQDMGTVHGTEVLFEQAAQTGLRYVGGKAMMDGGGPAPARLREPTQRSLEESVALARRFHGAEGGRLRYAFAPRFVLACSEALLGEVARAARELGARLHTHASENRAECEEVRSRFGRGNVQVLQAFGMLGPDVSLAHCVWLDLGDEALLQATATSVVHCPSANLKLGSGVAPVPELMARGVTVALGADGAACNDNLDAFHEMRLASLIHLPRAGVGALPPRKVFELATLGGARALGLEKEIGSLEVGKRADVVLLDTRAPHLQPADLSDPYALLVHQARGSDVRTVIVDGKMLVQDRRLVAMDAAEVVAQAQEQLARLQARL